MAVQFSIQVSLPVFKHLTHLLEEGQSHDDILREVLGIDSILEVEGARVEARVVASEIVQDEMNRIKHGRDKGFASRGLWLPNGTRLRARYKQVGHLATIANGRWTDSAGGFHSSPSAAASAITRNNVNGLRFWEAKRPGDKHWRRLDVLAASEG